MKALRIILVALAFISFQAHAEDDHIAMIRIPGKNYEIGKYEVTQGEWREVMGNNPSNFSDCGDTCPVEQVSWNDVQEFISKLNTMTGKQYRLPTEAEWEYACYGGSQSEYCGSSGINAVAWYKINSGKTTHPVGQKQANGYGLYDMSGNVNEWVSDCWEGDCAKRVLRGGSWQDMPHSSDRQWNGTVNRYNIFGFRLAQKQETHAAMPRTLVEVEYKTTKGCKIIFNKDALKEDDKKLEKLEWTGACKGGYAEGDGTATVKWSNGNTSKTVATFRKGREDGQGSTEFSSLAGNKIFFRGNFTRGLPNGSGDLTLVYPNGDTNKYKGNFVDGLPEGQGRRETAKWVYSGEFRENKPSGKGRFEYVNKIASFKSQVGNASFRVANAT